MDSEDCTVYSFVNGDGSFDFIRISNELHNLIAQHGLEENFVEAYAEYNLPGTIELLIGLGLSRTSVMKNMQLFPNCPEEIARKMMENLDSKMVNRNDNEENILYN